MTSASSSPMYPPAMHAIDQLMDAAGDIALRLDGAGEVAYASERTWQLLTMTAGASLLPLTCP
jgi:hypothetical protein